MAFNDMGVFQPSKSSFVNPGEYEATQRNVALQKGTYMAEMDRTYAMIEEDARQFNLTNKLENLRFKLEQEKYKTDTGFRERELGQQDKLIGLESKKVGLESKRVDYEGKMVGLKERELDLGEEEFNFTKDIRTKEFEEGNRQFDISAGLKGLEITTQADYIKSLTQSNEYGQIFDWIGLADQTLGKGGILENIVGGLSQWDW